MLNTLRVQDRNNSSNLGRSSCMSKWSGRETRNVYTSVRNVHYREQEDLCHMMHIDWTCLHCRFRNRDDNWHNYPWRGKFLSGKQWRIYQKKRTVLLIYKWDNVWSRQNKSRKLTNILYKYTTNCYVLSRYQKDENNVKKKKHTFTRVVRSEEIRRAGLHTCSIW